MMRIFFNLLLSLCFLCPPSFAFYPSRSISSDKNQSEHAGVKVLSKEEQQRIDREQDAYRRFRERIEKKTWEFEKRLQKQRNKERIGRTLNRGLSLAAFILVLTVVGSTLHQVKTARHAGLPFSMGWLSDTVAQQTEETVNNGHFWAGLAGASTFGAGLGALFIGKERLNHFIQDRKQRRASFKLSSSKSLMRTDSLQIPNSPIEQKILKKQIKNFVGTGVITLITFLGWELGGVIYKQAAKKAQLERQESIESTAYVDFIVKNQYVVYDGSDTLRDLLDISIPALFNRMNKVNEDRLEETIAHIKKNKATSERLSIQIKELRKKTKHISTSRQRIMELEDQIKELEDRSSKLNKDIMILVKKEYQITKEIEKSTKGLEEFGKYTAQKPVGSKKSKTDIDSNDKPIPADFLKKYIPHHDLGVWVHRNFLHYLHLHERHAISHAFFSDIIKKNKDVIFTEKNKEHIIKDLNKYYDPNRDLLEQVLDISNLKQFISTYYKDVSDEKIMKLIKESKILSDEQKLIVKKVSDPIQSSLLIVNESTTLTDDDKKEYKEMIDDPNLYQKFLTNIKESFFDFKRTRNDRILSAVISMIQDEDSSIIYDTARNNIFTGEFITFVTGLWFGGYASHQIAAVGIKKSGLMGAMGPKAFFKRSAIGIASFIFMMTVLSGFIFFIPADTQSNITLWLKSVKQKFTRSRLETQEKNFMQNYISWIRSRTLSMYRFQERLRREFKRMKKEREEFTDAYMRSMFLLIHSLVQKYASVTLINQTLNETDEISNDFMSIYFQTAKSYNTVNQALQTRKSLSCSHYKEDSEESKKDSGKCKKSDNADNADNSAVLFFTELDEESKENLKKEREEIKKEIIDLNKKISKNYHHSVELYGKHSVFFMNLQTLLHKQAKSFKKNANSFTLSKFQKIRKMIEAEKLKLLQLHDFQKETFSPFLFFDERTCENKRILGDSLFQDRLEIINKIAKERDESQYDYKQQFDRFEHEIGTLRSYILRTHGPVIDYIELAFDQLFYFSDPHNGKRYKEKNILDFDKHTPIHSSVLGSELEDHFHDWDPNSPCNAYFGNPYALSAKQELIGEGLDQGDLLPTRLTYETFINTKKFKKQKKLVNDRAERIDRQKREHRKRLNEERALYGREPENSKK